jgi:hypothetical protein
MANTFIHKSIVNKAGAAATIDVGGTPADGLAVQATNGAVAFVGTARLEGSVNGVKWDDLGAVAHGMVVTQIVGVYKYVRGFASAYTSGTLEVVIAAYTPQ